MSGHKAIIVFNDKPSRFDKNFFVVENEVICYLIRNLTLNEFRYMLILLMTQNRRALPLSIVTEKTGMPKQKITEIRNSCSKIWLYQTISIRRSG